MTKQETDNITLSQLIMHEDETIYRLALGILKRLRALSETKNQAQPSRS